MLKNYLLVSLRNIGNNKLFSAINIIGLAIGLSACFLIWQYVRFESGFDTFHENANRLYRVPYSYERNGETTRRYAANTPAVGYALKQEFPEIENFCRVVQTSLFTSDIGSYYANALEFSRQDRAGNIIAFNEKDVLFADAPILKIFTFNLIAGQENALTEPNSLVITERMARKYFGSEPALGHEMRLNRERVLTVTGVIEDVPENSHLQFDFLISFSSMKARLGDMHDNWGWGAFYTYILLEKGAAASQLNSKLHNFKVKYLGEEADRPQTTYRLQPITDIHLRSDMIGEQSPGSDERTVYFLSILAILILAVAWINYINLSTAKALDRSKEVGLRKTVGATRAQLFLQFLFDTACINLFAVLISVGLIFLAWEPFAELVGRDLNNVIIQDGAAPWLIGATVLIAGIFISGAYPAVTLSSFSPATVLKGRFIKSSRGAFLRKLMVSFQYVLAVLLIAGTVTIYLQLQYMRSLDPGFAKEQILIAEAPAVFDSTAGYRISSFKNGVLSLADVRSISATSDIPGQQVVEGSPIGSITATEASQFFQTAIPTVDTSFFSTFGINILEGRLFETQERMEFRRKDVAEEIPVLVNEKFASTMNVETLQDAINEKMTFWWGPDQRFVRIIGVVANHRQLSFKENIAPMMYVQPNWHASKYFAIKMQGDVPSAVSTIGSLYTSAFPAHPFTYFFLDEHFDQQYRTEDRLGKIFNTFTALAIIVTCLGLLGLSVFSVTQRTKEVGVRKVLGASATAILVLFCKDFVRVLLISYTVAVPIIYWVGNNWLDNFSVRIPIVWQIFTVPPMFLFAITLFTIGMVSLKALFENPVRALRHE